MALPKRTGSTRRGFQLLEIAAAVVILGVALSVAAEFSGLAVRVERGTWRHQQAMLLAHQRLEQLTSRPYAELTPETLAQFSLTNEEAQRLGNGELRVLSTDESEPPSKRLTVEVRWRDAAGMPTGPLRLSAWVYPRGASP